MSYHYSSRPFCGCWHVILNHYHQPEKKYLPQVDLASSTQVLATTSRTALTQTFINPSKTEKLDEVQYTFPLYDGVSVVGFQCTVGSRTIVGVVKEKQQARVDYKEAIDRGETAGLLEQLPEASDVFTTKIGNVPAGEKIVVEIIYLGELKHDAETDGSRFTIPTFIAPRYGNVSVDSSDAFRNQASDGHIRILVDVIQEEGSIIRGLQSPSHPIAVTMGRTSSMDEDAFDNNHASATLTLGSTELDKDFIIIVLAKGQDTPRALLETHSSIPDQRAIMATLVPKFNLPSIHPEIVFVVDRSGSMGGKIPTLVSAMKIFLKSLPVGVKFNICSFGNNYDFLFKKSKTYDQISLDEALRHLGTFDANYGGTEMLNPIKGTVKNRFKDMPLEVMVLTDGEIWNQQALFEFINKSAKEDNARFFSLGIGSGASSSLVEGIARAGDGFAQFVGDNEAMDKRVVRMLKGALTPHIKDYSLEIKYEQEQGAMEEDFEIIESATDSLKKIVVTDQKKPSPTRKVISLFSSSAKEEPTNPPAGRYDHLPTIATPKILQAPHKIPPLYPFNRTTVYLLMSQDACRNNPKAVVLRATSEHGPLELEIPIQDVGHGQTIHQLAAKKAVHELEEGRGWITDAKNDKDKLLSAQFEGRWDEIVEREAVRLGVQFQVGGKWCSFVAVEKHQETSQAEEAEEGDGAAWEIQEGSEKLQEATDSARSYGFGSTRLLGSGRGGGAQPKRRSLASKSDIVSFGAVVDPTFSFGRSSAQAGNLFGRQTRPSHHTSSLFGNTTTSSNQAGFSFGGITTPPNPTVSLFRNVSTPPGSAGSLFGNTTTSSNQAGFSFGSAGSLFGSTTTPFTAAQRGSSSAFRISSNNQTSLPGKALVPIVQDPSAKSSSTASFGCSVSMARTEADNSASLGAPFASTQDRGNNAAPPPAARMTSSASSIRSRFIQSKSQQPSMQQQPSAAVDYSTIASSPSYSAAPASQPSAPAGASQFSQHQGSLTMPQQQNKSKKSMFSAAPRKQLASKAARKSTPDSPEKRKETASVRRRSIALDSGDEEEVEEMSADVSDGMDLDATAKGPGTAGMPKDYTRMSDEQKMHELIGLQNFDGSWDLGAALLKILGVKKEKLTAAFSDGFKANEKAQATIAAIVFLEVKVKGERDVWEMVVEKARAWAEGIMGGGMDGEIAAVKNLIEA